MTTYWRTEGGDVVHIASCPALRRAGRRYPWHWPGDRSVEAWLSIPWLRACGRCMPEERRWQREQLGWD